MTRPIKTVWYFLVGLLGLNAGSAMAEGVLCSNIQGESQRPGSEGCIDVLSWSWGLSNSGSAGGGTAVSSFQSFNFTSQISLASEDLFRFVATQQDIGGVIEYREFRTCAVGCSATEPYLTIRMRGGDGGAGVRAVSFSSGGSSGNTPGVENYSLEYDEISYCYRPDVKGAQECFAFSRLTNKSIAPF